MTVLPAGRNLRRIRLKYEVGGAASGEGMLGNCGSVIVTLCVCSLRYSIAVVVLLLLIIIIINTDVSVCHPCC